MAKAEQDMAQGEDFGAAPHERPVPRISIHAFCEFPDTGAALQRAAADRRLSKAHCHRPARRHCRRALDHYSGQVDAQSSHRRDAAAGPARRSRKSSVWPKSVDSATKVVVVGRVNDVELYRELMRRGVSEYLVAPLNPLHLIEVISGLYLDPEAAPDRPRRDAFVGCARRRRLLDAGAQCRLVHRRRTCTSTRPSSISTWPSAPAASISTRSRARASPTRCRRRNGSTTCCSSACSSRRGDHLSLFTAPAVLDRDL